MKPRYSSINEYLRDLDALYASVKCWVPELEACEHERKVALNEERFGEYDAPRLVLKLQDGRKIASLLPLAADCILSLGAVRVVGTVSEASISFHKGKGPMFNHPQTNDDVNAQGPIPLFDGIDGDGWYWIPTRLPIVACRIDESGFRELLDYVSDYG